MGARRDSATAAVELVSTDQQLADDISLIAAVVGVRLTVHRDWSQITDPGAAVATICTAEALPRTAHHAEGTLLAGHHAESVWSAAAQMPGLIPVPLPAGERWLTEYLSARVLDREKGTTLAVAGSTGGAGATTFSYLCAAELAARGRHPLLVDAAPGPSSGAACLLDVSPPGGASAGGSLDWTQLTRIEGSLSPSHLQAVLPIRDGIGLLTGTDPGLEITGMLAPTVSAGRRAFDAVVIDIGQHVQQVTSLGDQIDELLIITRASRRGVEATGRLLEAVPHRVAKIVVNGASAPGWSPVEVAQKLGAPVVAELADQRWLRKTDEVADAYELLRNRRGAAVIGELLEAVGAA